MSKIPVLEIFGPTIQGEGMCIGQKTMFIRTAGCDYQCSWCDSAFTWDGSGKNDIKLLDPIEIFNELKTLGGENFNYVTISGGNPALLGSLSDLVDILKSNGYKLGIETQGSKWQDWLMRIDDITLSPKPPSSGMITDFEVFNDIVNRLRGKNISIKVVVFDDEDLEYARKIHLENMNIPLFLQVGNSDIETTDDSKLIQDSLHNLRNLIDKISVDKDFNNARVLPQLHTLIWGNKRGV
ncbi:MAG: queE [Bacillales bacterium]|jgi:7-carboxy-7-deazaguanine synthase|nr:queE [Bacillales bacterium]